MKGKLNLKNKIIIIMVTIISVVSCLIISLNKKQDLVVYAANPIFTIDKGVSAGQQFSAKFDGDILFSVEKVLVSSTLADTDNTNDTYDEGDNIFYQRTESETGGDVRKFHNYYNSTFIKEVDNNSDGKYVVEDNSFVMLNNIKDNNAYIVGGHSGVSEAILISFGQYILNPDNSVAMPEKYDDSTNPDPRNSGITRLQVTGYHNGEIISDLPGLRNIKHETDGRFYFDFMHIIPQVDGKEGHYQFQFTYMVGGTEHSASFEFYLMFETLYTGTVDFKDADGNPTNNVYNIAPTLGWVESTNFSKSESVDGYVRYYVGKSGINSGFVSYPTITYDYSKYTFNYTHTANGKETDYVFDYTYQNNMGSLTGNISYNVNSKNGSVNVRKNLRYINQKDKLVTIVLTDPGIYQFNFTYVYLGYNSSEAPDMNLDVTELPTLYIHGAELNYSKHNYLSTEMKYLEVSDNQFDKVDVIFPTAFDNYSKTDGLDRDGKDISDFKNDVVSFIYKLNEGSKARVGDVIIEETIDSNPVKSKETLINASLKNKNSENVSDSNDYDVLLDVLSTDPHISSAGELKKELNLSDFAAINDDGVDDIFNNINYEKTNQGSLWFTLNDKYDVKSYYFYSTSKIDSKKQLYTAVTDVAGNITEYKLNDINSITTFNKTGYYLVLLKILPNGMTVTNTSANAFYAVYAFEYSTNTININVQESTGLADETKEAVIGAGKFTKENVKISWKDPDVFERAISANFYTTTNTHASRTDILKTQSYALQNRQLLGNANSHNVANGAYLKFLIELKSEGESATYKMFTIDRQPISGVMGYVVAKNVATNNSSYYDYDTNVDGSYKTLTNAITDSYATLYWNDKNSGADIKTTYTFTPFIKNSTKGNLIDIGYEKWMTTNYNLGKTIGNFNLEKTELGNAVDFASVLSNQGIYVFTLTDEAGNSCKYAITIDKTEAWFYLDDTLDEFNNGETYSTGTYQMFGNSFKYNVGTHKVFKLDLTTPAALTEDEQKMVDDRNAVIQGKFEDVQYFNGANNNRRALEDLFVENGPDYYFVVENISVAAYNPQNEYDSTITALNGMVTYSDEASGANTSLIRTLYIKGKNNIQSSVYKDNKNSISKITFEINTDNAKGMVYYSSAIMTEADVNALSAESDNRLTTGSDKYDKNGVNLTTQGLMGAHATNREYVIFKWQIGTGDYEVNAVYYDHYRLNLQNYDSDPSDNYNYFYYNKSNSVPIDIYREGVLYNGAKLLTGGGAYFAFGGSSITEDGLYKVTREYKTNLGDDASDVTTLSYYFIVDRNKIIDVNNRIGEHILIKLLEYETPFNTFNTINASTGIINKDELVNETYSIYLNTTKVPATLQIPAGKYYNGTNSSDGYYAGKLGFKLYYIDNYNQLSGTNKGITEKIFDTEEIRNGNIVVWEGASISNGCYNINVYDYIYKVLDSSENGLRSRLCVSATSKNWLSLPGTYVMYIYDMIEPTKNKELLAFRINKGELPTVDFTSSNDKTNNYVNLDSTQSVENGYDYKISTNDEFIKLTIPEYDIAESKFAQVDPNYLVIEKVSNNIPEVYITHEYKMVQTGKYNINKTDIVEKNNSGFATVLLETDLRDENNDIDYDNLSKELYYLVTIRYKLSESANANDGNYGGTAADYLDCYTYYDANNKPVKWYDATYKIIIDRQAPTANINNLINGYKDDTYEIKQDEIIADYNVRNGTDTMFENGVHEEGNDIYFTHQYVKYYQAKISGNETLNQLYALKVNSGTMFDKTDVSKILYRQISNINTIQLKLPIAESDYESKITDLTDIDKYGDILTDIGYYEFVELDAAGNTTQYIVLFTEAEETLKVPVSVVHTEDSTEEDITLFMNEITLTIFNLKESTSLVDQNGYFFKIELTGKEVTKTLLTDFSSDFNAISEACANMFKNLSAGEYELTLYTRYNSLVTKIILYPENEENTLNARNLIKINSRNIDLRAANYSINNVPYFAKQVVIKSGSNIDVYITNDGGYTYSIVIPDDDRIPLTWQENDDITYKITITDVFGRTDTTNFNTKSGFDGFYSLSFDGGDFVYDSNNDMYYSYRNVILEYNKTLVSSFAIYENDSKITDLSAFDNIVEDDNVIKFIAPYNSATDEGKLFKFRIEFYDSDNNNDETYNITIDTRIPKVSLVDYATYATRDMAKDVNLGEESLKNFVSDKLNSGIANLSWEWPTNEYFYYTYTLRVQDGNVWKNLKNEWSIVNNVSSYVISEGGTYQLVINVYADEECTLYLGNKVYAFNHASENEALYYIRDAEGKAIEANSSFKYSELGIGSLPFSDVPTTNLPLYITKTIVQTIDGVETTLNPSVVINDDLVDDSKSGMSEYPHARYTFYMYKISTTTYSQYFGLLVVDETFDFISSASIGELDEESGVVGAGASVITNNNTSFNFANNSTDNVRYAIQLKQDSEYCNDYLLRKNGLILEVYYNNSEEPVKIISSLFDGSENTLNYEILGNGYYTFKFKDLAGNIQLYNEVDTVSASVLREVVVTINNEAPVDNAYYNDAVELRVYASAKYDTGSITVTAELNGMPYHIESYNPVLFEDYGNYKVTIKADYTAEANVYKLEKVIRFTIINRKEVRTAIDLTSINNYKITKVVDSKNNDVTNVFSKMLNVNAGSNAMIVSYDKLLEYKNELNIATGKQSYAITYLVEGFDYPPREVSFEFTLNNETPKIDCDLEPGETTTKGFTISFNPGILYEQIGDAYVMINDEIVVYINEFSDYNIVNISKTFKGDGDGDYYIQLVGTSGNVWLSYKATIKEPLNFWAIIIIVVVVVIVVTITVTIIVLRNKMRIR